MSQVKALKTKSELYETAPISKAIIALAVPTILSQLITVLYNMADTFFIGQLDDPSQVAAATLCMPPFILLSGFANLLGIGGSSLISRSLGKGDKEKAKKVSAFCVWMSGIIALFYGLLFLIFKPYILPLFGTTDSTYEYCFDYLFWTVTIGAIPTVLSGCLAHLIRSEGFSKQAGIGIALGGILNIILDPLFIFGFNLDIKGAAIATTISNYISLCYLLIVIVKNREKITITLNPKYLTFSEKIPKEVLSIGLPNFVMNLMGIISNTILNNLMASYSDATTAGMGIAKKIDMMTFAVSIGMSQGVISLIAYNYSSKNYKRMYEAIKTTFKYLGVLSVVTTLFLFFLAAPVSSFFIDDVKTIEYSQYFIRVLCIICPMQAVSLMCITIMQALGQKIKPLIISFMRKGTIDAPLMLLLNVIVGVEGIAWSIPIAELAAMIVSIFVFLPTINKIKKLINTTTYA